MPSVSSVSAGTRELFAWPLADDCTVATGERGYRICGITTATPIEPSYVDGDILTGKTSVGTQCGPTIQRPSYIESATGKFTLCMECPGFEGALVNGSSAALVSNPTISIGTTIQMGTADCGEAGAVAPKWALAFIEEFYDDAAGICVPGSGIAKVTFIGLAKDFRLSSTRELSGSRVEHEYTYNVAANPNFTTVANTPDGLLVGTTGSWDDKTGAYMGFLDPAAWTVLNARTSGCDGFIV